VHKKTIPEAKKHGLRKLTKSLVYSLKSNVKLSMPEVAERTQPHMTMETEQKINE
jgi:hypothetical protein